MPADSSYPQILHRSGIRVASPAPNDFRKRQELDTLDRFLEKVVRKGYPYPMATLITCSEQPDIILTTELGAIGVEITSIQDEITGRALNMKHVLFPDAVVTEDTLTSLTGERPTNASIAEKLATPPGHELTDDTIIMDRWKETVARQVTRKLAKLNSPTFQRFKRNDLLLHDILPMVISQDALKDAQLFLDSLPITVSVSGNLAFDTLIIHSDEFTLFKNGSSPTQAFIGT